MLFSYFLVVDGVLNVNLIKSITIPKKDWILPKYLEVYKIYQILSLEGYNQLSIGNCTIMELIV